MEDEQGSSLGVVHLKASDLCGDHLQTWALDPQSSSHFQGQFICPMHIWLTRVQPNSNGKKYCHMGPPGFKMTNILITDFVYFFSNINR